jgi:hypothetical protein
MSRFSLKQNVHIFCTQSKKIGAFLLLSLSVHFPFPPALCVCSWSLVGRSSITYSPSFFLSLALLTKHQGTSWYLMKRGPNTFLMEGTLLPRGSGSTRVMEGTPCKRWLKQANKQRWYWGLTLTPTLCQFLTFTLTLCQFLTLTLTLCQLQNKDEEEHIHCGCAPTDRVGDRDQRTTAQ